MVITLLSSIIAKGMVEFQLRIEADEEVYLAFKKYKVANRCPNQKEALRKLLEGAGYLREKIKMRYAD